MWTVGRDATLIKARKRYGENFRAIAEAIRSTYFHPSIDDVEERWDILMGDLWGERKEFRRQAEDELVPSYEEDVESGNWIPPGEDEDSSYLSEEN